MGTTRPPQTAKTAKLAKTSHRNFSNSRFTQMIFFALLAVLAVQKRSWGGTNAVGRLAQKGPDAADDLFRGERLGDVAGGANLATPKNIGGKAAGREHDDR